SLPVISAAETHAHESPEMPAEPRTLSADALPSASSEVSADPVHAFQDKLIEGKVIEAVRNVYDPEIPVNIYDLGLIYEIHVEPDHSVRVKMTLTAPACPVAGTLPGEVETKIQAIPEVTSATVELVWDPPWSRDR